MKKYLSAITLFLFMVSISQAASITRTRGDISGAGTTDAGWVVDSSGNLSVTGNINAVNAVISGTLEVTGNSSLTGTLSLSGGLINVHEVFTNAVAVSTMGYIKDVHGASVSSSTLLSTGITYTNIVGTNTAITPKTVTFEIGGVTKSTGTVTITGINARGVSTIEAVAYSLVATSYESSNAFVYISTVTFKASAQTGAAAAKLFLGIGDKIGLANDISAYTDVYGLSEAGAAVVPVTGQFNATYNTYDPTTATNGTNDYEIWYKAINR